MIKVKDQLSDLRENGDEVGPEQLEGLLGILAKDATMCRRLKPDAFALLIEVLLEMNESKVRERGFYILAVSISVFPSHKMLSLLEIIARGSL